MSAPPLPFTTAGINVELIRNLSYKDLLNYCKTHPAIKHICDTDPNILNLKLQKYVQYIMEKNDNDINKTFFYSIKKNDITVLNYLLNVMNFDPSIDDNEGLMLACEASNYAIVNILLRHTNVDPLAREGTALLICVEHGNLNILDLFLNKVNLPSELLSELFIHACENDKVSIVSRLLEYKELYEDINILNDGLTICCDHGFTDIFDILINIPEIEPSDECLESAISNGHLEIFHKLILDKRVQITDNMFITACSSGQYEMAKELLKFDIDPTAEDQLALHYAVENGHIEIVKMLLDLPEIDPSADDQNVLNIACQKGYYEIVEMLLKDDRIDPTFDDCISLQLASKYGYKNIVELFINDGRIDSTICYNKAFEYALKSKKYEIADILVPYVDKETLNEGIKLTCKSGNYETTELLLSHGADPSVDNNICIIYACKNNNEKIVLLLLKDSRVDPTVDEYLPLVIAIKNNNYNIVNTLISDNRIKVIPMFIIENVITIGNLDIFDLLLKKIKITADILNRAVVYGNYLIVNRLLEYKFTKNEINEAISLAKENSDILLLLYDYLNKNFPAHK